MIRISSAEFQKKFGQHQDEALRQPVVVTRNGRDRTVLISVEEYRRLKRRDRQVLELTDFTAEDIAAIERATPSGKSAQFDHELG
jgi:prevent-host-death family protein